MRTVSKFCRSTRHLAVLVAALGCLGSAANADSLARASAASLGGSMTIVEGSLTVVRGSSEILVAGGQLVVESVKVVGESVVIVLTGLGEASRIVLTGAGEALAASAIGVGQSIAVVSTAAGHVLYRGSEVLAFVPNEIGHSLVHSSYHGESS